MADVNQMFSTSVPGGQRTFRLAGGWEVLCGVHWLILSEDGTGVVGARIVMAAGCRREWLTGCAESSAAGPSGTERLPCGTAVGTLFLFMQRLSGLFTSLPCRQRKSSLDFTGSIPQVGTTIIPDSTSFNPRGFFYTTVVVLHVRRVICTYLVRSNLFSTRRSCLETYT